MEKRIKVCDRCGKNMDGIIDNYMSSVIHINTQGYETEESLPKIKQRIEEAAKQSLEDAEIGVEISVEFYKHHGKAHDLCPSCTHEFKKFMKGDVMSNGDNVTV